jgi:CRP-like cAMP-binding protein
MRTTGNHGPDFLAMLDPSERDALQAIGRRHTFRAGTTILHERLEGDQVMLLLSGRVKVTHATDAGREVVLGLRGPGDLVGELAVIDREPRSGSVTAVEPVEALAIAGHRFRDFLDDHPRAAMALLRTVTHRFRDADRKRIEFGASDTVGRVAARLVELAEAWGAPEERGVSVGLPLSQEELGGWCGCSREAVAKALQTMRRLGWIETSRRGVTLLDADAVRARAG